MRLLRCLAAFATIGHAAFAVADRDPIAGGFAFLSALSFVYLMKEEEACR